MKKACYTKVRYDTLFPAERAAAISSYRWKTELVAYPCGNHYHIGHADPRLWGKVKTSRKNYCEVCEVPVRPHRYHRHILTEYHLNREASLKEKSQG